MRNANVHCWLLRNIIDKISIRERAEREEREAAEKQRSHLETVERLKRRGFTDPAMQGWTFENDNGKCPQMEHAHFYVENWETMKERNIGYLLWGGVGTGKVTSFALCLRSSLWVSQASLCNTVLQNF